MALHSIDTQQKLYIFQVGGGSTCLGFDVARDRTIMYAELMGDTLADAVPYGTLDAYQLYERVERRYIEHPASQKTTFDPYTPNEVKALLEHGRQNGTRLRLYYGDQGTGRDWNEENDMIGYVGRSLGPIRVPLLVKSKSSSGGPAILTACIIKLQRTSDKRVLWQHSKYHSLPFAVGPVKDQGFVEAVYRDGELHAQFKRHGEAVRFIDKMLGRRMG